jgi:hypothetical protein
MPKSFPLSLRTPTTFQAGAAAELAEVLGDNNETVAALTAEGEEALSNLPAEDAQKVIIMQCFSLFL